MKNIIYFIKNKEYIKYIILFKKFNIFLIKKKKNYQIMKNYEYILLVKKVFKQIKVLINSN